MENTLSARNEQRQLQQLTPNQLASLQMLAAPLTELEARVAAEVSSNPLLEIDRPEREELIGDVVEHASMQEAVDPPDRESDEADYNDLNELASSLRAAGDPDWGENGSQSDTAEAALRHEYLLGNLKSMQSLAEMLSEQLRYLSLPDQERKIAQAVIDSIDERGFLATHPADIAMAEGCTLAEINQALEVVQSFDPPGVGAIDAAQSLLLQLQRRGACDPKLVAMLTECRDELEHNRLPLIARKLQISIEEIYRYLALLKTLNPVPASGLEQTETPGVVVPEMSLELHNGELQIVNSRNGLPRLTLVGKYLEMLHDPATPKETKEYLAEKLSRAETLLKQLDLRASTMERITEVIARRQKKFFLQGPEYLVPMTMQEVAEELHLHETTVSRAVSGKYLATPQGVLEYRSFFTAKLATASGEEISNQVVKGAIRKLIAEENPQKPLSDAALANALTQQGYNVARRTVAKYRESLNIPAASLRKVHTDKKQIPAEPQTG